MTPVSILKIISLNTSNHLQAVRKYILPLSFILCSALLNSQIDPMIPAWVQKLEIGNIPAVNKNQIRDGYYYLLIDKQYNNTKRHNYYHYAMCAITEEALTSVSQIEFSYDPEYQKAVLHHVIVHRNGRAIDKTRELELKKLNEENERNSGILNGKKTLYANLSDIRKNDIIEYSYSIIGDNPIMKEYFNYDLTLSYEAPIGRIYNRLILDKRIKPNMVYRNTALSPEIITGADFSEYIWNINSPAVVYYESATPSWYNPNSEVQISNFETWETVKKHCLGLFRLRPYSDTELKSIIDSITRSTDNLEKQITSSVEFVQTQIRYSGNENGIYSHVPRTPDIVIKNRYGDCKEKTVLLNEMLRRLNIKAFPVLVNTYLASKTKDQVPSVNSFNHVISGFIYKDQLFFIDPTISYQRGSFMRRPVPAYEIGMILDEKLNTFELIPSDLSSSVEVSENFFIEASGNARLNVTSVFKGSDADNIRYEFLTNSIDDIQESYKKFYSKFGTGIRVSDSIKYEDNSDKNEFITYETYVLPEFWRVEDSAKSREISKDFMPYSLNSRLNYGEEAERKDPLKIAYPLSYSHTITITKEGGWDIADDLKKEDNRFFSYTFHKSAVGDKAILVYNYNSKASVILPSEYKDYKAKMDFVNYNMVFTATQQVLAKGTLGFNWPLVVAILMGLSLATVLVWHLNKRPHITDNINEYDAIGGWLIVVGIGITITPLILLVGMIKAYSDEMGVNYLVYFFDEKSIFFSPLRGYYNLFIPFFNSFFLIFSILIVILFYKRKSAFRPYYAIFRITNTAFLIINVGILHFMYSNSTDTAEKAALSSETTVMIRNLLGTLIWVPYVLYSDRSLHTFTNANGVTQSRENEVLNDTDINLAGSAINETQ